MARAWGKAKLLPSGRWQASFTVGGERYLAPNTFATEREARAFLSQTRRDLTSGKLKIEPRVPRPENPETFGAYASAWVAQRRNSRGEPLRPITLRDYRLLLATKLESFHQTPLMDITPARVRAWHAKWMAAPTQAGYAARLFHSIMQTAVEDDIIPKNPVPSSLGRTKAGRKFRPPSEGELSLLVAFFVEHAPGLELAVILAAFGGLRFSEWRGLRRQDISTFDGRVTVTVERQVSWVTGVGWVVGPPKSVEGVRRVMLPGWAAGKVQAHLEQWVGKEPGALLFPGVRGEFMSDRVFNRVWDQARDLVGVRGLVREHDLRAFAGTHFARSGATLRETMAFLGHSTTAAAMAYQHDLGDRQGELVDRMPVIG